MSQRAEIIKVVTTLAAAFPHKDIEEATIRVYTDALADLPPEAVRVAGMVCLNRCRFFPSIAELREEALRALGNYVLAHEAWREVCEALSKYDADSRPIFADAEIQQAVDEMGWRQFCLSDVADAAVWYAHFSKIYKRVVEEKQRQAMLPLSVQRAIQSLQKGKELPPADGDGQEPEPS